MANFAILRTQKLKSRVAVAGSLKHMYREQDTPNADMTKTQENTDLYAESVKEGMKNYSERINSVPTVRKNAVHAVEFLVTGSPEKIDSMNKNHQNEYFEKSMEFIEKMFGKENVIAGSIHRDEKTPHLSVVVMPITPEGKLSYRKFLGGNKNQLSKLQTDFADQVGKEFGLERGVEKSKAKHRTIKEYYSIVNDIKHSGAVRGQLPNESNREYMEKVVMPLFNALDENKKLSAEKDHFKEGLEFYKENLLPDIYETKEDRIEAFKRIKKVAKDFTEKDLTRINQEKTRKDQERREDFRDYKVNKDLFGKDGGLGF